MDEETRRLLQEIHADLKEIKNLLAGAELQPQKGDDNFVAWTREKLKYLRDNPAAIRKIGVLLGSGGYIEFRSGRDGQHSMVQKRSG